MDIEIIGCPIVREADGLAKSSRNTYLSEEERRAALCLSKSIFLAESLVKDGETSAEVIKAEMRKVLEAEPLARIDYVEAVNSLTIEPVTEVKPGTLIAIAVYIGKTRLIDNTIIA